MAATLKEVEEIIKELSEANRGAPLQKLIDEMEPIGSDIEKTWSEESKDRLDAMRVGKLDLIDDSEPFAEAFRFLGEKDSVQQVCAG